MSEGLMSEQNMEQQRFELWMCILLSLFVYFASKAKLDKTTSEAVLNITAATEKTASRWETMLKEINDSVHRSDAIQKKLSKQLATLETLSEKLTDTLDRDAEMKKQRQERRGELYALDGLEKTVQFDFKEPGKKVFEPCSRSSRQDHAEPSTSASAPTFWDLHVQCCNLGDKLYHNTPIERQNVSLQVELRDRRSGSVVKDHPPMTIKVDALYDKGDAYLTAQHYNIVQAREGKPASLLSGKRDFVMSRGIATVKGIKFTDSSRKTKFRFGAQVVGEVPLPDGIEIKPAASDEAFIVLDKRSLRKGPRQANGANAVPNMINYDYDAATSQTIVDQQHDRINISCDPTGVAEQGPNTNIALPGSLVRSREWQVNHGLTIRSDTNQGRNMDAFPGSLVQPPECQVNCNLTIIGHTDQGERVGPLQPGFDLDNLSFDENLGWTSLLEDIPDEVYFTEQCEQNQHQPEDRSLDEDEHDNVTQPQESPAKKRKLDKTRF